MLTRCIVYLAIVFGVAAPAAAANCVISDGGKAINVVTDNSSTDEQTCNVTCKVDTKAGLANVSCGGNTPPLATDHSLCHFERPAPQYNRVVSAEGSCK